MVVEEEYNNNHTRLTGWDVSVGDDSDIIEWVDGDWRNGVDEDGYMTLVSVVKSDDGDAQLVYIWKFDPEYRTRDITVTLDGTTDLGTQNVWWSDDDISGTSDEIGTLANQGYTFSVPTGYTVDVDGNDWTISSIPTGYEDLTINITSEHVDIEVNGNLTLNTMAAKDGSYDPYAGNIWGDGNTISYNFVLNTNDDIASVSWVETVYVDDGVENKQVSYENKTATSFYEDNGELRVQSNAAPQYVFGANDKVTVVISDLVVDLVKDEPVVSDVTVEDVTLSRTNETSLSATITMSGNVSGYASVQLQIKEGTGDWESVGTAVEAPFTNDTATCAISANVAAGATGTLYRVVVTNADGLTDGTAPVVFEVESTGIR